jgi:4-hydroxyphenylpyruvate dioxygenase-like putative hemolysin
MADSFEKPMGLLGFEFVEFASPTPGVLEPIFEQMGFTLVARHRSKDVVLYRQGDINFIINREPKSFAGYFAAEHGPCACGMAFRVKDSHLVYERALALGAQPMELRLPAIKGSGQIEEFLMQFNGEGIQHIALVCDDLVATVDQLALAGIPLLSAPNDIYYDMLETRLPGHGQPVAALQARGILLDGSTTGGCARLLLQIFSKPLLGPVFFEFIQREGDEGFGEGNFKALFESLERDQVRRGVIGKE